MKMEPRISIITLGVEDLDRAATFYAALGLERHEGITDGVAFFQMGGLILALWPREELARDVGLHRAPVRPSAIVAADPGKPVVMEAASASPPGVALAYNTRSEAEVGEILALADKAGGRVVKQAGRAVWGGMQGYFYDTEGNLWEVAYNPDFPIDAEGRISLP